MKNLKHLFQMFREDQRGNGFVEATLMFPLILFCIFTLTVVADFYHAKALAQRGTTAIAEIIAHETTAIESVFITKNYQRAFAYVTEASNTINADTPSKTPAVIRVTLVRCCTSNKPTLIWSETSHSTRLPKLTSSANFDSLVPNMMQGDITILVDTKLEWTPSITPASAGKLVGVAAGAVENKSWFGNTWFGMRTIETSATMRPKFAVNLCWKIAPATACAL